MLVPSIQKETDNSFTGLSVSFFLFICVISNTRLFRSV